MEMTEIKKKFDDLWLIIKIFRVLGILSKLIDWSIKFSNLIFFAWKNIYNSWAEHENQWNVNFEKTFFVLDIHHQSIYIPKFKCITWLYWLAKQSVYYEMYASEKIEKRRRNWINKNCFTFVFVTQLIAIGSWIYGYWDNKYESHSPV